MSANWDELGIEPTHDAKEIRRAYARRLKSLDPDRDATGFQRLRQAYEAVLADAARPEPVPEPEWGDEAENDGPPTLAPEQARPMPPPAVPRYAPVRPPPPRPRPEHRRVPVGPIDAREALLAEYRPAFDALSDALNAGDAVTAVRRFEEMMARGLLGLHVDPSLILLLSRVAVDDPALPGETFCALMRRLGWYMPRPLPGQEHTTLASDILARLSAEGWYAQLLADARGRGGKARVARMLLGRNSRYLHYVANATLLAQQVAQYDRHARWLAGRLDPDRVASLRRGFAPRKDRMNWWGWWAMMIVGTFLYALLRACIDALPPLASLLH